MIALDRGLRHLQWADDAFFATLERQPPEALEARATPTSWTVGHLARHIVEGAQWYRYCLTGTPWTDLRLPQGAADIAALRSELAEVDATLVAQGALADQRVAFRDEHGEATAMRSTILTQACLHGAEHRAQISIALDVCGFSPIVLDDLDLWAFELHGD